MSIVKGQTIVYQDLVNAVLNLIETKCQNVGNIDSIGASLKPNNVFTKSITRERIVWYPSKQNYTATAKYTNSNSPLTIVTKSTIENEFNSFLTAYGIARKANTVMTMKGILHFMACASAFIKTKIVILTNDYDENKAVIYVSTNSNFPAVTQATTTTSEDTLTAANLKDMVNALNNNLGHFQCYYNVTNTCCSSCSSSCSSSSSSSSSSWYIAYIDLGIWQ